MVNQKAKKSIRNQYVMFHGPFLIALSFIYIVWQLSAIYYFAYKSSIEWYDIIVAIYFVFDGGLIIASNSKYLFKN